MWLRYCKCGGGWRYNQDKWVVVERQKDKSRLKCLRCRSKWWSRRFYIASMRDHKERSRRGCTDEQILSRLQEGSLRIDPETSEVWSRGRLIKQRADRHGAGYSFVEICCQGKKKKIGVHVLQWMQAHGMVKPSGYDVHHLVAPRRPGLKDNRLSNLQLEESVLNQGHYNEYEAF